MKRMFSIFLGFLFSFSLFFGTVLAAPTSIIPDSSSTATDSKWKVLGQHITSGNIELTDVPLFLLYVIEFLIYIAGGIAIISIMVGGYQYIIGAITESKDAGKKRITNSILGFAVATLAYIIVDLIVRVITG